MNGFRQGYIEKKRSKELIADEIEALMMGARPPEDKTKPEPPTNLQVKTDRDTSRLVWSPADDQDPSSWVVGYRIYSGEKLLGSAYGTQFILDSHISKEQDFEVRAVNVCGLESNGARR